MTKHSKILVDCTTKTRNFQLVFPINFEINIPADDSVRLLSNLNYYFNQPLPFHHLKTVSSFRWLIVLQLLFLIIGYFLFEFLYSVGVKPVLDLKSSEKYRSLENPSRCEMSLIAKVDVSRYIFVNPMS